LRCSNVYGEGQQPHRSQGVVATALASVVRGEPIPLFDNGNAVRDFIHVDDVVNVVCTLAGRNDRPAVLNVGSGVGTSVRDLLAIIADVTGLAVQALPKPARPGDVRRVVLDITLLQSLMAFAPFTLSEGIARTWFGVEGAGQLAQQ
jgi:UDP-glucose 4-epimerase